MPSDAFEELFDREQLLAGLPAKRAGTLLFLIESRTARLTAQAREAMQRFPSEEAAQQRELAFIEAFALGREPPLRPTVQDLERHAPGWAPLVARNPRVQAALARRMGEKYRLVRERVPAIRAALGLDEAPVAEAFARLYDRPLQSIYVERPAPRERVRWARAALSARLEGMSPFWTAYALTLTETVGSTIVALPIALAAVGPLPAVAILVALGLVNVVTVAYMADALTRNATVRHGDAYIGRVVAELLGRPGALVLTTGVLGICLMGMQADYIGVSVTLDDASGVPAIGWVALLFAIELAYLRRGSIDATVSTALVVGAVNILLILLLSALAFAHLQPDNLTHVDLPFVGGSATSLALVFGVTFTAYFGHLSVSNCARVVLARDPSGRTLVRGVVGAQVTAIVLYVLFVVAVAGAVAPAALSGEEGTALSPLAEEAGTAVLLLGGILVVLGMGMASIHSALALFYLVRERLPARAPMTLVLPRRGARILLEGRRRERTTIALTYVGQERGAARFRLDVASAGHDGRRVEVTAPAGRSGAWQPLDEAPLDDLGARGLRLGIRVIAASDHEVRAEVETSLRLRYDGEWDSAGVSLAGLIALPDREAGVLAQIMRRPDAGVADVAELTGLAEGAATELLDALVRDGLLTERMRGGERRYVARAGRRRGGRLPAEMWEALGEPVGKAAAAASPAPPPPPSPGDRIRERGRRLLSGERGRFLAGISPVVAIFLFAAWQATSGAISLADVLSFLGVIIVALLAGVFPVLLLVAARQRGELQGGGYRVPGQRWVLATVYAISLGGVLVHGLFLWDDPLQRASAFAITLLALVMTASMARAGSFAPRATVQLRHDAGADSGHLAVVVAGRAAPTETVAEYDDGRRRTFADGEPIERFSALRSVVFTTGGGAAGAPPPTQLRVWAHRITAEHESEPLAVSLEREADGGARTPVVLDAGGCAPLEPADGATTFVMRL
ncbi:MAG: helix-turn-helix domain-containing protein [Solirubrobacteraceae bacterium]|nr:helix-turn-helix domain-containing protein [Solirubrobacteraceae bacterium]